MWAPQRKTTSKTRIMKMQTTIIETAEAIAVESPYSKANNETFRGLGGKFDRESGRWILPRTETTKDMIAKLFGGESPLATVEVTQADITEIGNQWQHGGYVIATRRERDDSVFAPAGVQLAAGSWAPSGGSQANPRVTGTDLSITVVVRQSYADREKLTIIATHDQPLDNPMAPYADADLIAECRRRGIKTTALF
jgi:hypothetical protein